MLKMAVVSDIHLGHKRNSTTDLIKALDVAFPFNEETAELDILFIAGDVFDRLLDLPSDNVTEIQLWIARILKLCAQYKIKLRVLEGTASHDWKQSELFITLAKVLNIDVNVQYIKTVSIEYFEDYDINVLYMPDDWNFDPNDTLNEIKNLIKSKGLQTVDYGVFHGNFEYQLPEAAKNAPRHNSEEYLKLVSKLIFIGHIHTFSNKDRIYAQGSFGRLAHNEEEPKGHLRVAIEDDGTYRVTFVENKLARKYITIDCGNSTLDELLVKLRSVIDLPHNSCVRLVGPTNHPTLADMNVFIRTYPDIVWTRLYKDKNVVEEVFSVEEETMYSPIQIDKHNVTSLLMNKLIFQTQNKDVLDSAKRHLTELL